MAQPSAVFAALLCVTCIVSVSVPPATAVGIPDDTGGPIADLIHEPEGYHPTTATVQNENGTITGSVTVNQDEPAAGVQIITVRTSSNVFRLVRAQSGDLLTHTQTPPVEAYRSLLASPKPPGVYTTTTGTNGEYSLSVPPGTYAIRALDNESTIPTPGPGGRTPAPTVTVQSSSTEDVDISLGNVIISNCFCPELSIGTTTGQNGETVTVNISTTARTSGSSRSGENVTGYDLNVTYDPSVARVTGVTAVDMPAPDQLTINNNQGWVDLENRETDPVAAPTIVELQLEIATNESASTHLLFTADSELYGANGDPITVHSDFAGRVEATGDTSLASQYDTDDSDKLELPELQTAIDDWQAGKITLFEITTLVQTWSEERSV